MKRYWDERSPRERSALAGAAAIVGVLLVATLVWLPLERVRTRLAQQVPALRASIATLEIQAQEVQRLRAMPASPQGPAGTSLAALAAQGTNELAGARFTALDPKRMQVSASDVAFGALLSWLASAQASQGLRVETAHVEALAAPGRVRAELTLVRS